jgi:hypothetical protein
VIVSSLHIGYRDILGKSTCMHSPQAKSMSVMQEFDKSIYCHSKNHKGVVPAQCSRAIMRAMTNTMQCRTMVCHLRSLAPRGACGACPLSACFSGSTGRPLRASVAVPSCHLRHHRVTEIDSTRAHEPSLDTDTKTKAHERENTRGRRIDCDVEHVSRPHTVRTHTRSHTHTQETPL